MLLQWMGHISSALWVSVAEFAGNMKNNEILIRQNSKIADFPMN